MVHWNAYIAYSSRLSMSWFSLWNKNPLLWVKVTITMSGWDYTSTMKPYVCVYVLRPFFRIVLGSKQNWGEGAESSHVFLVPQCWQPSPEWAHTDRSSSPRVHGVCSRWGVFCGPDRCVTVGTFKNPGLFIVAVKAFSWWWGSSLPEHSCPSMSLCSRETLRRHREEQLKWIRLLLKPAVILYKYLVSVLTS